MRWTLALLLVTAPLAGCLGDGSPEELGSSSTDPTEDLPLPELEGDKVHMDVRVPVVTVGFPDASVEELDGMLDSETVAHAALDLERTFPPDPDEGVEGNAPLSTNRLDVPIVPTARYDVQAVDNATEQAIADKLDDWRLDDGEPAVLDGRSLEAYLADALPEAGHELDPNAPSIVLIHLDALGEDLHTWRYDYPLGVLEEVRVFGEREPMLVLDPSGTTVDEQSLYEAAQENATGEEHEPYADRLDATGEDLEEIAEMVRRATHYRVLQGSIYPMPLADCHAMTLILGVHPTSVAEHAPPFASAEELFHPDQIERAFENLTGDEVHLDARVLTLPVDDPALDALGRGEFATMPAQRWWFEENWQDYWVPHEGCEAYVSFTVHNDAASTGTPVIGIGTYDHPNGHRISLSWVNEAIRAIFDPAGPVGLQGDTIDRYNWIDYLFAHEIGHTIGQRHPHDITTPDGGGSNQSYDDVWSSMSYDTNGRVIDFGAIDQANWQRNQAGWMVHAALRLGLENTTAFEQATQHLATYEWSQASDALRPTVMDAAQASTAGEDGLALPTDFVLAPSPSTAHGFGPLDRHGAGGHDHGPAHAHR